MISLSDFFKVPPLIPLGCGRRPRAKPRRDCWFRTDTTATNTCGTGRSAVGRKGSDVSAYRDLGVSAVRSIVAVAATVLAEGGTIREARVGLTNMSDRPL